VLTLFGGYRGTIRTPGFHWANPFFRKAKISLRARNLNGAKLKVNDQRGNPIIFAASYAPEVVAGERKLGCRKLANAYPNEVFRFEASHDRYTTDMDTPDDYARICGRLGSGEKITA
jgi:CTP:molybdopterin cytidylyltransferase MocA